MSQRCLDPLRDFIHKHNDEAWAAMDGHIVRSCKNWVLDLFGGTSVLAAIQCHLGHLACQHSSFLQDAAMKNLFNTARYQRLDASGPNLGAITREQPLSGQYFHHFHGLYPHKQYEHVDDLVV